MKTYLELMESFKNYVNLHEETKRHSQTDNNAHGFSKSPAQIFTEVVNGNDKSISIIQQFVVQTEEILTNKRHSFKIEPKNTDNLESITSMLSTFKEAFDRFLNDCTLIREDRQEASYPRRELIARVAAQEQSQGQQP
jgi:hypothetical protein